MLRALSERFPRARLFFATSRRYRPLLQANSLLEAILETDEPLSVLRALRKARVHLAIDLQRSQFSAMTLAMAGIPLRLGRPVGGTRDLLLSHLIPAQRSYTAQYRASLLRVFGVEELCLDLCLPLGEELRERALRLSREVPGSGPLVALSPAASSPTRACSLATWARVGRDLRERLGARLLLVWGPGELPLAQAIADSTGAQLAPPTDTLELAALLGACAAFVGTCSGPRHLAVSQRVPTLVIHGSTAVGAWTRPSPWHRAIWRELPCRPCNRASCPTFRECLELDNSDHKRLVDEVAELLTLGPEPPLRALILSKKEQGEARLHPV